MSLSIWSARLFFPQLITLLYVNQPLELEERHCKLKYWERERNCWKKHNKENNVSGRVFKGQKNMLWLAVECAEVWKLPLVMLMAMLPRIFYYLSAKQWRVSASPEMGSLSWDELNVLQDQDYIFVVWCALLVQQGSGPWFFRNTRSDNLEWGWTGWVHPVLQFPSLFSALHLPITEWQVS